MALDRPVHPLGTADGATAPAAAAPVALEVAVHGYLAQMLSPPPPIFGPRLAGGKS